MIVFKRIKLTNFLSVGNEPIELYLNTHNLTLVTGENGASKSAICVDSIFYALYGKSFRKVVLSNLINSTNKKNLLVEVDFTIGENDYSIIRGQKPNKFEIYINGKLYPPMANVKDYQSYLTNYILKMDEKTFRQLVVIGSSSYTPFMMLSASERRVVIEDLLRIDIFSSMQSITKQYISDITNDIRDIEGTINILRTKLEMQQKNSAEKINQFNKTIDEENAVLSKYIDKKDELEKKYEDAYKNFKESMDEDLSKKIRKISDDIGIIKEYRAKRVMQGEQIEKHINFFSKNDICPTCTQKLDKNFVELKLTDLDARLKKFKHDMVLFDEKINELSLSKENLEISLNKIKEANDNLQSIKWDIKRVNSLIESSNSHIASLKKRIEEEEGKDVTDILSLENELKDNANLLEEKNVYEKALLLISSMLKDDGIKKIIIKSYIPIINKLIEKYLDIMNFGITFELDENFNEIVKTKNKESYEYNNFSEGEKMRLDCAIMFSFRELAKIQSSISTNLLILDEFDRGTLDENGFQSNVDILRSCKNENIIVISHSPDYFSSIADRIIYAKKEDGFSKIDIA